MILLLNRQGFITLINLSRSKEKNFHYSLFHYIPVITTQVFFHKTTLKFYKKFYIDRLQFSLSSFLPVTTVISLWTLDIEYLLFPNHMYWVSCFNNWYNTHFIKTLKATRKNLFAQNSNTLLFREDNKYSHLFLNN